MWLGKPRYNQKSHCDKSSKQLYHMIKNVDGILGKTEERRHANQLWYFACQITSDDSESTMGDSPANARDASTVLARAASGAVVRCALAVR